MTKDSAKSKSALCSALAITAAWITVPLLGVIMFILTSLVASATIEDLETVDYAWKYLLLSGIFGILILSILLLALWKTRRRLYSWHLMIGLWIGMGLYALFLICGSIGTFVVNVDSNSPSATQKCSDTKTQFLTRQAAVIPIHTNLATGTGFAVTGDGNILTANHVVEGAESIVAGFSSGEVKLTVIKSAPEYDLALLKMDQATPEFFSLTDRYSTADTVYSYGYPSNSLSAGPPSVAEGIISRTLTIADLRMTDSSFPDGFEMIQTDAAINPGNSGGPLIGKCGVVGIVVSISDTSQLSEYVGAVSEQGIGYAVSAKSAATKFNLPIYNGF